VKEKVGGDDDDAAFFPLFKERKINNN